MRRITLTEKTVASLKTTKTRIVYWDKKCPTFGIRVSPSGHKAYCIMYRINRRLKRRTIGTFPRLSVKDARKAAMYIYSNVRIATAIKEIR